MKKFFRAFFVLIFFLDGQKAEAASLSLPRALYTINDFVEEFRGPFRVKIEELSKNYIVRRAGNSLTFTSHEVVHCLWRKWEAGAILSRFEYFYRKEGHELTETLRYSGCGDQLSLVEKVYSFGEKVKPLNFDDFSQGKRNFELEEGVQRKVYRLENERGEELFSLYVRKIEDGYRNGTLASFHIRGQEFIRYRKVLGLKESRVIYHYEPYEVSYKRFPWYEMNIAQNFTPLSLKVIARSEGPDPIVYLSSQGERLSSNSFLNYINWLSIERGLSHVKNMTNFHLHWFPTTEFQSAVGQSQRLMSELKLMLTRLLNNTELNLVRNYVRELITAVESNFIIDKRPRE